MKVVLLAGGFGSRISEESQFKPKPMIEIGGMPILWHIMKEYAYYGYTEFVVCAGYKQEYIKVWFANYFLHNSDVTFDYRNGKNEITVHQTNMEPWKVTVVDTGYNTMTGGRIKRIQKYVGSEPFMLTYGDGVCDVEIDKLVEFHKSHGKLATLTAVKMAQDKGVLDISENNSVRSFREKNASDGAPINAGYMVLQPEVFGMLDGDSCVFEKTALVELANKGELMSLMGDKYYPLEDCVNKIIEIIDCNNDAIVIAREKIVEQYVWHDPTSVLENFGARLTLLCSFIVKRNCLECLDRCNKYCGHNFIHIGILMEYLCKKSDIKVTCISGYFDVWSHSKSYWENHLFEVFSKDWFYTIMSIPNSISVDSKLKCLRGSNTRKNCFNPLTILRTKGSYNYSLKDFNDNRQFLELTSWTTYYTIFPIIILPNSIFKFARYIYKSILSQFFYFVFHSPYHGIFR